MERDANDKKITIGGITYLLNEKEKIATVINVNEEAVSEEGELAFPNEITSEENANYVVAKIGSQIIDVNINRFSFEDDIENDFPKNIQKIVIPESITEIQQMAFKELGSIEEVEFQGKSKLKYIGANAFFGCSALEYIEIPESVTIIDVDAFRKCYGLPSLTFPKDSTVIISERSFEGCKWLKELHFLGKAKEFKEDIEDKKLDYNMNSYGAIDITEMSEQIYSYMSDNGKNSLRSITIPKGVTSIGRDAFYGCIGLEEIIIPEEVTSIGNGAFAYCDGLTEIIIPEGVTSIGKAAFEGCDMLEKIIIPEGVTSIGDRAFYECDGLTEIKIPEGVTSVGQSAFEGCRELKEIKIPEGVTSIGKSAFSDCIRLEEIKIPERVTNIERDTFYGCSGLKEIKIPQRVTSIEAGAFAYCDGLTEIIIPEGVTSIGKAAFEGCNMLEKIIIPEGVTSIGRESILCMLRIDKNKNPKRFGGNIRFRRYWNKTWNRNYIL